MSKKSNITSSPKKRSSKLGNDEGELSLLEQNLLYQREIEALKLQLIKESNKSTEAELIVKELRIKLNEIHQANQAEKQRNFDISMDATRQYKSMREELIKKITQLQDEILLLKDTIEKQKLELEDTNRRHQAQLLLKQNEIDEQKSRMDDMAQEFGHMLKQTLDKMSEKIELTNEWEQNGEEQTAPVVRTFEDFSLGLGST